MIDPDDTRAEQEGRAVAESFRRDHHLGTQPLGDLVALIEQTTGIDVAVLDAEPDEHGLVMRDPRRGAIFIGVARTSHPMRQRSTLAHELGHVLFEDWSNAEVGDLSKPSPKEDRCRAFARHLLVPVDGVRELYADCQERTLSSLSATVQRFLVSPAIAAIAWEQAGFIDLATSKQWGAHSTPQLAARFGWSDQYHALRAESNRRRAPQRLLARAIKAHELGVLSAQTIATLRGVPLDEAEAELSEAGVAQGTPSVEWVDAVDLPDVHVDLPDDDENDADPPHDNDSQHHA